MAQLHQHHKTTEAMTVKIEPSGLAELLLAVYMTGNYNGQPTYDMEHEGMKKQMKEEVSRLVLAFAMGGDEFSLMVEEAI